jgi:hypothetical protein
MPSAALAASSPPGRSKGIVGWSAGDHRDGFHALIGMQCLPRPFGFDPLDAPLQRRNCFILTHFPEPF